MNIESGNFQFYKNAGEITRADTRGQVVINDASQAGKDAPVSGNAILSQAQEGQTFTGQVVDINGLQVTIQMEGNQMLQARMAEAMNLNMGDSIAFLVKENTGNVVTIKPLATDMQSMKNQTIFDLLEKNQLSPSDKNYQIAEALLSENMPADRASMQKILQQAYRYPEVDVQTIVSMNKMNLPVTEETIAGFEQYQTNQHAMMQALSGMTEELTTYMSNPEGMQEMLPILSDTQDLPVLDMDVLLRTDGQSGKTTPDILNPATEHAGLQKEGISGTVPGISAEQIAAYAEKFGMAEGEISGITDQLLNMHLSAQTIQTVFDQSDTPMQLANHLQALVSAAADHAVTDTEKLKEFIASDNMKALLEMAVKDKFTLNPEKMEQPQELSDLYKHIYEKMNRLMQQMGGQDNPSGQHLSESAKGMQERILFLQNLSNLFPYAQLPVRMEGRDGNADLFVYMNKKRLQEKKEDVSALLHLDMEFLGPTDVHVSLRGTMVHTKFYVEDEESAKLIDAHMNQLEQAVAENGYSLTNEVIMREPTLHPETEKNAVIKEMFGDDDIEKSVKRYSFDVRM